MTKNILAAMALAALIAISYVHLAHAQGGYYDTAQPPSTSTSPGLTNPKGSTVYVPNTPTRTLGGTPPKSAPSNTRVPDVISTPSTTNGVSGNSAAPTGSTVNPGGGASGVGTSGVGR